MQPDAIQVRPYQPGDGALIPVAEADPFGFWLREIESIGRGLTSYYLDDLLVAVTFYTPAWDGVADSCALVNRDLIQGNRTNCTAYKPPATSGTGQVRYSCGQLVTATNQR